MRFTPLLPLFFVLALAACSGPAYLSVPVSEVGFRDPRLAPSRPEQAILRDQHLGQLREEMRWMDESVLRAEQDRLQACRAAEAGQVASIAYQRCQIKDQIYEGLKRDATLARSRYLRAVSGQGGGGGF